MIFLEGKKISVLPIGCAVDSFLESPQPRPGGGPGGHGGQGREKTDPESMGQSSGNLIGRKTGLERKEASSPDLALHELQLDAKVAPQGRVALWGQAWSVPASPNLEGGQH